MTKRPDPETVAGAVQRIVGDLGIEAAAAAVGKSERLVYLWGDEDSDARPSIVQAIKLDRAYQFAGHGRAPILEVYRRVLKDVGARRVAV